MLQLDFFESHLGHVVAITKGADALIASVSEVHPFKRYDDDRRQPFSVLLEADTQPQLPRGIYTVEFGGGEHHDLFIEPVGPREGRMLYEMVFT